MARLSTGTAESGYFEERSRFGSVGAAGASLTYSQEVLADSPIWYVKLDDAALPTAVDSSANALNGTYINSPSVNTTDGPLTAGGKAATFVAASSQNVVRAHSAALNMGDVFTIEAFIKRASSATTHCIFAKRTNAPALYVVSGNTLLLNKLGVASIVGSSSSIGDNVWTHVAATKNGATVKLYINGADATGSVTNQTCANNALDAFIGNDVLGNFLSASMAHVAIYNTALSAARISAHYAAR